MMHWKASLSVLALLAATLALSGCSQPCRLPDYDEFTRRAGLPADLTCNPDYANRPSISPSRPPTTINDLDREPYYITLKECIALALEKGHSGTLSISGYLRGAGNLTNSFNTNDDLSSFIDNQGLNTGGIDSIRVFALRPAIVATDIEASLSRYDVVWRSILGFNTADQNPLGPNGFRSGQNTAFGTSFEKGLPTGGLANVTFGSPTNAGSNPGTNFYNNFSTRNFITGTVNPSYTPNVALNFTQPLLRGFGTEINSLLTQHPLSPVQQLPGSPAAFAPAIVIARINFDQSRAEFERVVNYMVLNVEASYYQLYALYVNLYSTQEALKQSHTAWKISKAKYEAGTISIGQFELARATYEDFRGQRIIALSKVLEQERELRLLCGLQVEDGKRLIPVDTPTVAPYTPNWDSAWQDAVTLRPELAIARADIKRKEADVIRDRNNLLPDLRLETNYTVHGFGPRLDGNGTFANGQTNNALRDLAGGHYTDYNVGLTAAIPLGYRGQNAAMQAANLRLANAYEILRDQEKKAINNLTVAYRNIFSEYNLILTKNAQRTAAANQVEARFKEFLAGKITVDFLLDAQRQWAAALAQEYQAIANYNLYLALFEFSKGTLLNHNGIQIAEGPLPQCVQVRAVEHERERAHAIACLERTATIQTCGECGIPEIPTASAPSLPALMMDQKGRALEEVNHALPRAGSVGSPMPSSAAKGTAVPGAGAVAPVEVMVSSSIAPPAPPNPLSFNLPTTPSVPSGPPMPTVTDPSRKSGGL